MSDVCEIQVCNRRGAESSARPDGVVVRRLVRGQFMDVTEYTVPRGFTTGPSDSEVSEKAGYVVRGTMEIVTAAGTLVVEAGGEVPRSGSAA